MKPLSTFFSRIPEFKPDLLIFSGLHLFDGKSKEFYLQKLDEIAAHLQEVNRELPVHLELASMAKRDLVENIIEKVVIYPHYK